MHSGRDRRRAVADSLEDTALCTGLDGRAHVTILSVSSTGNTGNAPQSRFDGVLFKPLPRYTDPRGWLIELFRNDELPDGMKPAMGYISSTEPGIARGPHEHEAQSDAFVFLDGKYELYLWENRPDHEESGIEIHKVGGENPVLVIVPPGVVHAYRNVGDRAAFVLNFPDKLYAGEGKKEMVDEIRHEDNADSRFKLP